MSEKKKKRVRSIGSLLLVFVLLAGAAAVLIYPEYVFWRSQKTMDKESAFIDSLSGNDMAVDPSMTESVETIDEAIKVAYDQALPALREYNVDVRLGRASAINDPFGFDKSTDMLSELGIKDGLIGYINIPAMKCRLPLYLGASEKNMTQGATVISGTSVPLGEKDSNCVIAGHRGYNQAAMFRDIEDLQKGDTVEIVTAYETLIYKVVDFKIISPDNADALRVVEGRDLVTLFTCHPYPTNYQRYLVYCERVGSAETDFVAGSSEDVEVEADAVPLINQLKAQKILRPVAFCVLGLLFVWWLVALVKTVRQKRELG